MAKASIFGRHTDWIVTAAVAAVLVVVIEYGLGGLDEPARTALLIFALAVVGWAGPFDNSFVALTAAVVMALAVAGTPDDLFRALGDNIIWLLVAAFIFAAAFRKSGLADLMAQKAAARARTVRAMFYSLAGVMVGSAFVIPSTSGRAAIMLPIFGAVTEGVQPRIRVAFALLMPTVILLSAFGSLIGAGAHIVALELLMRITGESLSFAYWALLCLPFAILNTVIAIELILSLFLTHEKRGTRLAPIEASTTETKIWNQSTIWVMALVLFGWFTAPWHGINETLIAVIGALLICMPRFGAIGFKEALKEVDWNLLVFLAATNSLAQAMVRTGLGDQLLHGPLGDINNAGLSPLMIIGFVALVSMSLHLFVHSRTARDAVLIPPVLLLAEEAQLNATAIILVTVAATGLCQTLMVSAKPVIMFGQIEGKTYSQADLFKLSAVLFPVHLVLIILFASLVWPLLGVSLVAGNG